MTLAHTDTDSKSDYATPALKVPDDLLLLKNYSYSTRKIYRHSLIQLLKAFPDRKPGGIEYQETITWLLKREEEKKNKCHSTQQYDYRSL